jgi:hypothetical protein
MTCIYTLYDVVLSLCYRCGLTSFPEESSCQNSFSKIHQTSVGFPEESSFHGVVAEPIGKGADQQAGRTEGAREASNMWVTLAKSLQSLHVFFYQDVTNSI